MKTDFSSEKEKHNYFNRMSPEQKLDAFGEILSCCSHVAFLGGAGVSTESGIPDFRSRNGLYRKKERRFSKYKPEYLLSYDCLIIGGTSLEVGSAAQLAHMYHGKYLIIINKGKTRLEGKADLVFHDRISTVLQSLE